MSRKRTLLTAAVLLAIAVPFLAVRFPPIMDLPQHAAQARLLAEALADPASPYQVQWLTPYGLATWLVGACWAAVGPAHAGRLAALLLALLWVATVHWFAWRRDRPAEVAVLASLLVFNHTLYWGFFSFQLGVPLFLIWLECERAARREPGRGGWALLFATGALYFTHVLWWAVAAAWLVVSGLRAGLPWRQQARRWAIVAPFAALAVWWFPRLQARGFTSTTTWGEPGLGRLVPEAFVGSVLGGLRGSTESIVVACLLVWLGAGAWSARRRWRELGDRELALGAALFFAAAVCLPYRFQNSVQFGQRWMPVAMLCALLFVPPPPLAQRLRRLVAAALLAGLVASTALTWKTFERVELDGLPDALAALPENQRLLGLNYFWDSPRIAGYPFVQTFAYGQVLRGGSLNFSFADHAPCLVVYREPRRKPWTPGLEWFPHKVRRSDLAYFDFVLVNGDPAQHEVMAQRTPIEAVSRPAAWRLYRVVGTGPAAAAAATSSP